MFEFSHALAFTTVLFGFIALAFDDSNGGGGNDNEHDHSGLYGAPAQSKIKRYRDPGSPTPTV